VYVDSCMRHLNDNGKQLSWLFSDAAELCRGVSKDELLNTAQCALDAKSILKFNKTQAVRLCRTESAFPAALKYVCASAAFSLSKSVGVAPPDIESTIDICSKALLDSEALFTELKRDGIASKVSWTVRSGLISVGSCFGQTSANHINGIPTEIMISCRMYLFISYS